MNNNNNNTSKKETVKVICKCGRRVVVNPAIFVRCICGENN